MLAEGHEALIVDNLLVCGEIVSWLREIVSIVLIELVEKLAHDVLRLSLIDFLTLLLAIRRQRHLSLVRLQATHGEHKSMNTLLILI